MKSLPVLAPSKCVWASVFFPIAFSNRCCIISPAPRRMPQVNVFVVRVFPCLELIKRYNLAINTFEDIQNENNLYLKSYWAWIKHLILANHLHKTVNTRLIIIYLWINGLLTTFILCHPACIDFTSIVSWPRGFRKDLKCVSYSSKLENYLTCSFKG